MEWEGEAEGEALQSLASPSFVQSHQSFDSPCVGFHLEPLGHFKVLMKSRGEGAGWGAEQVWTTFCKGGHFQQKKNEQMTICAMLVAL